MTVTSFRLIISPEDDAELGSLRDFTRRLMVQIERDLETTLDWVAIDHYNTGHPYTHIVIRCAKPRLA
jgi:type IV secretory pathway VirD2 relaxase